MTWWMWMLVGLVLLASEILTPGGFYLIFFGAAGLAVGALKILGLDIGLAGEGLLFAVLSVAGLLFFRKPLMQRFQRLSPELSIGGLTEEVACAKEEIAPGAMGKVELRGTAWNATNIGDAAIAVGARCAVERVEGLTLYVRAL
jgi:membrane protein implicated in regulation of membrane protease activity